MILSLGSRLDIFGGLAGGLAEVTKSSFIQSEVKNVSIPCLFLNSWSDPCNHTIGRAHSRISTTFSQCMECM